MPRRTGSRRTGSRRAPARPTSSLLSDLALLPPLVREQAMRLREAPRFLLSVLGVLMVAWVGAVMLAVLTLTGPADATAASVATSPPEGVMPEAQLAATLTVLEDEIERLEAARVDLAREVLALETSLAATTTRLDALDALDAAAEAAPITAAAASAAADVEAAGFWSLSGVGAALGAATAPAKTPAKPAPRVAAPPPPPVTISTMNTGGRDLYNCRNFSGWEQAQAVYEANLPGDPNHIDTDRDGIACESLRR